MIREIVAKDRERTRCCTLTRLVELYLIRACVVNRQAISVAEEVCRGIVDKHVIEVQPYDQQHRLHQRTKNRATSMVETQRKAGKGKLL